MRRHLLIPLVPLVLLSAIFCVPGAAAASERLAVLELYNPAKLEQQAVDYLTDRVRAATLATLGERVKVLTRENLVALLPPQTDLADCAGADCEIETGRRVGAGYVISGELVRLDATLKLSLKLHATGDGSLLSAEAASGDDADGLDSALAAVVARLVRPVMRRTPTPIFNAPVPLPAVPTVSATVGPLATVGFADVDLTLLDALQTAHRLEARADAAAVERAAAWRAVAERAEGERAAEARRRAEQWRARDAAEQARAKAVREAWARHRVDAAKLQRLLAYDASVVPPAQKKAWQAEFDAAYGPWLAEFERLTRTVEWVAMPGGVFEWEGARAPLDVAPFGISRTEVTTAQYAICVEAGKCPAIDYGACRGGPSLAAATPEFFGAPDQPAVCLTRAEARAYAAFVGGRLPTPTEWMFAARGGRSADGFPWGHAPATCERAVLMDAQGPACGRGSTWPVCSRPQGSSREGLCDVAGNAGEWVEVEGGASNLGGATAMGGSLMHATLDPRVIDRVDPESRLAFVGFRVVRDRPAP